MNESHKIQNKCDKHKRLHSVVFIHTYIFIGMNIYMCTHTDIHIVCIFQTGEQIYGYKKLWFISLGQ